MPPSGLGLAVGERAAADAMVPCSSVAATNPFLLHSRTSDGDIAVT